MEITLQLIKMGTELNKPVKYYLNVNNHKIELNSYLGQPLEIRYLNKITCIHCHCETKKSFSQGYCYSCFTSLPQTEADVLRPELCEAHNGIARDMEWAKKNCLIDHFVYLSITSNIKVGVTRHTQVPTRWIDQGAEYAIRLAHTPYRQLAGLIEVALKPYLSDKTNWRKMLRGKVHECPDLVAVKDQVIAYLPEELQYYISDNDEIVSIQYPVLKYPSKIESLNLDTTPYYSGILTGIKGQYLIFDNGTVFNVRKFSGYHVSIKLGKA